MSDAKDQKESPPRRGQAAWQEAKDGVAERNAKARKAGREQREAYELERATARRARERLERDGLTARHKG